MATIRVKGAIGLSCVVLSAGLLAGCAGIVEYEYPENTAEASEDTPDIPTISSWTDVEADFEDAYEAGVAAADDVTSDNVRETFEALSEEIIAQVEILEVAVEEGVDADAEAAAQIVWQDAATLETIGAVDEDGIGLYVSDLAHDAQSMVQNTYNGLVANFDVNQSEVSENYDRLEASSDEAWEAFIALF